MNLNVMLLTPIRRAVTAIVVYSVLTAALLVVNDVLIFERLELPWHMLWTIWAVAFFPAIAVTCLAGAFTAPEPKRLAMLYAGALLLILMAMEIAFAYDAGLPALVIVAAIVSVVIVSAFKLVTRRD